MGELDWATGFFDGEGNTNAYVGKGRNNWNLQMSVTQIHRDTLERFQRALGGLGKIYGPYDTKSGVHPQWTIKVRGDEVVQAIALMWDGLTPIKRLQAVTAIGRWSATKGRRPKS